MNGIFKLGAAVLLSIVHCTTKSEFIGNISDGIVTINDVIDENLELRRSKRSLENMSDRIAESCSVLLSNSSINETRQEFLLSLSIDTLEKSNISYDKLFKYNFKIDKLYKELLVNTKKHKNDLDTNEEEVYERLLRHIATIIIKYILTCPEFTNHGIKEIIISLSEMEEKFEDILDQLQQVNDVVANKTKRIQNFERVYRNNIVNNYDWVKLFGADNLSGLERPYKLSVAYVTLEMANYNKGDSRVDIKSIFENNNNIVWITGDAGSGKTTFLQWLAINTASNTIEEIRAIEGMTPIFVPLRSLDCKKPVLKDAINLVMGDSSLEIPENWIENLLEEGKILLLVDGVDEVKEDERIFVLEWIEKLFYCNPKIKIVITSRPQVEERVYVAHSEIRILPMTRKKVECFIDYWHNSVLIERLKTPEQEVNVFKTKLMNQLDSSDSIRRMSTNPLLCAMICALNYKNGSILAKERNSLYEDCCRMLLDKRDSSRNIILCKNINLNYEEKKTILSQLAYWMMKNNYTVVDISSACNCIQRTLKSLRDECKNYSSEEVFDYLLSRSGLLRSPVKDEIDFIHKSFQEYLAAYEISKQEDWGFITNQANNIYWYETLILSMGFAGESRATKEIKKIMKNTISNNQIIIAAACANNAVAISDNLRTTITEEMAKIMPPKTYDDIKNLSTAGEFAVPFLCFNKNYSHEENCNSLRVLQLINSSKTLSQASTFFRKGISVEEISLIGKILLEYIDDDIRESGIENKIVKMIEEHPEGNALIIPERFLTILSNESYKSLGNTFQRIKELTLMDYSANKNYSVFKKFNSLEKLTIIGDYTEIPILKVLGKQIKKLSLCDVGAKFDLYMLNKYPYDKLEEFCFHSNKSIYISGGDLAFLQEIRKLELYFYNEYAEIEFSKFENLKQLQALTIMSDTNYEYDYWPLSKHKTLKKIILKIPKDVEDSLYKTSNIDDTACCKELSIEEYDYPYGEI